MTKSKVKDLDLDKFSKLSQKERNEFYKSNFDASASSLPWSSTATTLADIKYMVSLFENTKLKVTYFKAFFIRRIIQLGHMNKIKSVYPKFEGYKDITEWLFKYEQSKIKNWLKYIDQDTAWSSFRKYLHDMTGGGFGGARMSALNVGRIPNEFMSFSNMKAIVNHIEDMDRHESRLELLYKHAPTFLFTKRENFLKWLFTKPYAPDFKLDLKDKGNGYVSSEAMDRLIESSEKVTVEYKIDLIKKLLSYGYNFDDVIMVYYDYYNAGLKGKFNEKDDSIRCGFSYKLCQSLRKETDFLKAILENFEINFIDKEIKHLKKAIKMLKKTHDYYYREEDKEKNEAIYENIFNNADIIIKYYENNNSGSKKIKKFRKKRDNKYYNNLIKENKKWHLKEEKKYKKKMEKFQKMGQELGFPFDNEEFIH